MNSQIRLSSLFLAVCLCVGALGALADVHTNSVKNGISNWNSTDSYDDGRIPQPGDVVNIPANCTVTVSGDDDDSFAIVSALGRICPLDQTTSKVVFDIPEGVTKTLEAPIYYSGYGVIEKTGLGELVLASYNKVTNTENTRRDYRTAKLMVSQGVLRMAQNVPMGEYNYGSVSVAEGATLYLHTYGGGSSSSTAYYIAMSALTGKGTVSCANYVSGHETQIRINSSCTFEGKLTGYVRVFVSSGFNLTGVESDTSLVSTVYGNTSGILGFKRIGNAGEPSSVGTASTLSIDYRGGTLRYLGTGEETSTDKGITVAVNDSAGPAQFDAGPYGGLTFLGKWSANQVSIPRMFEFVLKGSNTHECVLANEIATWSSAGTNCTFYITKQGTGTWRFADHASRNYAGGLAVEDGTVRFDSMEEKGFVSALGTAKILHKPYRTRFNPANAVPYAYALGTTNASGSVKTEGTLEYSGDKGVAVATRKTVLKGNGRLKTDSAAPFRYAGVSAVGTGLKTLTLDGSSTGTNEVFDITDGEGQVGIVKEGTGSWRLSGDLSFSGPVDVHGGTLTVSATPSTNYTWFVLNIKQLTHSFVRDSGMEELYVSEIGLFDKNGMLMTRSMKYNPNSTTLQPGECGMRSHLAYNISSTYPLTQCFNGFTSNSMCEMYHGGFKTLKPDDPQTWFPIIFRLKDTAKVPVATYDIAVSHGSQTGQNARMFELLGSVDGIHWDVLHSVEDSMAYDDASKNDGMTVPTGGQWNWKWMYTKTGSWDYDKAHVGKSIRGFSTNVFARMTSVSSYSVSDGAKLVAEGDPIEIDALAFDCARTAGTFENFTLAADGTLKVGNIPAGVRDVKLPIALSDFDDADSLADWSVEVDGTATQKWFPRVSNGELHLCKRGLAILVR